MPYFSGNFDICISSIGGVGSTMFMDFVANYKNINLNRFPPNSPGSKYKHSLSPPTENFIKKAILIIGNPIESFLSIQNRDMVRCHLNNLNLKYQNIPMIKKENDLIGKTDINKIIEYKDIFCLEEMYNNWVSKKNVTYPIMIIKYESIWDNLESIFTFLEIPHSEINKFPKKKQRNTIKENFDITIIDKLENIYFNLLIKYNLANDCTII